MIVDPSAVSVLEAYALAEARAQAARMEEACEAAVQTGTCGVLARRSWDGRLLSAEPHDSVPYGQIWELTVQMGAT